MSNYIVVDGGMGYYIGKKYMYEGCYYPCCSNYKEESKVYKSKKVAEKVAENINCNSGANYDFEVVEVK